MRMAHLLKNAIFFAPVFLFNHQNLIYKPLLSLETLNLMVFFLFFHGIAYILNDINDINKDRLHPLKKSRPLASGELSLKSAFIFIVFSVILTLSLPVTSNFVIIKYSATYFLAFMIYNHIGKKIIFLDGALLLSMFIIRLYYGAEFFSIEQDFTISIIISAILSVLIIKKRVSEISISKSHRFSHCKFNYNVYIHHTVYTLSLLFILIQTILFNLNPLHAILFSASLTIINFSKFKTDDLIYELFQIKWILLLISSIYIIDTLYL